MINNVTGIILAGGKSTRMGSNKAFLKIGDRTIIEEIFSKFKDIFSKVMIVANEIGIFNSLKAEVVADVIPSQGPLVGIYTSLLKSDSFYNFVVACDMPFIKKELIYCIVKEKDAYDAVIPEYKGRLEPLFALYSKNCLKPIETQLFKKNSKIADFLSSVNVKIINDKDVAKIDSEGLSFVNINVLEEYGRYRDFLAIRD